MSALGFQDAAAALAIAQFGAVVRRLGRGKDGGRDMEANGVLVWSGTDDQPGEAWDGYSVFQVKHHERPARTKADATWLWGEVRKELIAWADPDSNRDHVPKHLVFVSNVRLSPEPGQGGLAYVEDKIKDFVTDLADTSQDVGPSAHERRLRRQRLSALKRWKVVDGNQLDAWLDIHEGVRRAYGAFLTPGDVLADLVGLNPDLPADKLEPALQTHARSSLIRDRNIYFDEAGGEGAGVPPPPSGHPPAEIQAFDGWTPHVWEHGLVQLSGQYQLGGWHVGRAGCWATDPRRSRKCGNVGSPT